MNGMGWRIIWAIARKDVVDAIRDKERKIMEFIKSESFDLEKMKAGTGY